MLFTDIILSKDDFSSRPWVAVVEAAKKKDCWEYSSAFFAKASDAEKIGDLKSDQIFTFLAVVTHLHLHLDTPNNVFSQSRLSITSQQLDLLRDLAPEVDDAELRARIADLVWTSKRENNSALREIAVNAYLASAITLEDPEEWVDCEQNIERALQIASHSKLFPIVTQHIEDVLARINGKNPLFLSAKLMRLLYQYGVGDPVKYATLSEELATHAEKSSRWDIAREYWEIEADWHKRAKNTEARHLALLSNAEAYVKEASDALGRFATPHMIASSHLEHAIEAFRRIPNTNERVDELHKRLLEYQAKSLDEMAVISTDPIDITEIVGKAVEQVKGKQIYDALFALSFLGNPLKVSHLKQQAEQHSKDFMFQHFFPMKIMNAMGRTIARDSKKRSVDPEEVKKQTEENLLNKMFQNASHGWHLQVQACIEPAKHQINSEHNIRTEDFFRIVSNNPFVPSGREAIYAQGLSAGMSGDFLVAVHLLVPQVEHSIRHILAQQGIITTAIDNDGIQVEFDLNKTLKAPQFNDALTRVLGEDLLFNLRGLLVERFGANLRNDMAHGLLNGDQFYSAPSCYFWWLVLRLCWLPIIAAQVQSQQLGSNGDDTLTSE